MNHVGTGVTLYFWLVLIAFLVSLAARMARAPYALALVVTGLAIGAPRLLPHARLDPSILFTVFLPPLLFESAIHLRWDALRAAWRPIAVYTFAGTALSTFIVGGLAAWLLRLPLPVALVFGALISATDPISVIAVFKKLGAGKRLTLIVEAESLFNDGIAVVLFTVLLGAALGAPLSASAGVGSFFRLVVGGGLLGAAIGLAASRVHYELDDHLIEITLTLVVAFGSYVSAEALHVSGVIAVVAAGLALGNVGMASGMTAGTHLAVTAFWEVAAFVVNSIVFLLVGIEVATIHWADKWAVALGAALIVLAGRAGIYPLSWLVNRFKGSVPLRWQHVLFWGGLRGALSMALALGLPRDFPLRDTVEAATFGVVTFSLLAQGLTVGPLLRRLGLANERRGQSREQRRLAGSIMACEAALAELERLRLGEAHPNWNVELLAREYRNRLTAMEAEMAAVEPDHAAIKQRQTTQARKLALVAEKGALLDAERRGWLDDEDIRAMASRLDGELLELRKAE